MAPVDQFIAAIVQQETGGEANPYQSRWGKYAINPVYVDSLARQYLGRPMTAQQYMSNPANQDLLGRAALSALYNKYGAQGAASSWYSGNPNNYASTRSQPGGPSIKGYVDSVMGRMGKVNVDLTNQPANSPLNPWAKPAEPTLVDTSSADATNSLSNTAATALGIDAADGSVPMGMGVEAADGSTPMPTAPKAPAPQSAPPPMTGTDSSDVTPAIGQSATGLRGAAIQIGKGYLGVPYVWGGTSDSGLDCSGLVQKVLGRVGIRMPRVSYDQLKMGPRVALGQAQPGDLIGWGDGHHVAMYLGNNQILEEPRTGLTARVRTLGDGWDRSQGYYAVSLQSLYKG